MRPARFTHWTMLVNGFEKPGPLIAENVDQALAEAIRLWEPRRRGRAAVIRVQDALTGKTAKTVRIAAEDATASVH